MHSRSIIAAFGSSCAFTFLVAGASVALEPRAFVPPTQAFTAITSEADSDEELVEPLRLPPSGPGTTLHAPPLSYLKSVIGDPKPGEGELSVRVPVLMYHRIRPWTAKETDEERYYTVRPEAFEVQMAGIAAAGYHTITPGDLERALVQGPSALPPKPVLLTFDDGFREHYTRVLPILQQYNLQATFFVISEANTSPAHMTDDMIREVDRSGFVTIASHTKHHWMLAKLGASELADEVAGSKSDLEKVVGHTVSLFAYPFGSYSTAVDKAVRSAGYTSAYGIRFGSLHTPSTLFQLRRMRVQDGEDVVMMLDAFSQPED